ncbi:MAG: gamma-glutamyltransferase, partial [Chitinispirillia bacterium]
MFGYFNDGIMNDREGQRQDPYFWTGTSSSGIVTSAHYRATEAGAAILSGGGNAVDAAVATSLALGVVEPAGSGLGGMTMMMIHLAEENRTFILEGPCRAPVSANPGRIFELAEDFKKKYPKKVRGLNDEEIAGLVRKSGYHAVAVPTNAAVLGYALKSYGTLHSDEVVKPAVRLAEAGYTISPFQERLLNEYKGQILRGNAAGFIYGNESTPPASGFLLRQPVLANTLKRIGNAGFEDFYTGHIGDTILDDMKKNGGFITDEDFQTVPWPAERDPIQGIFEDWSIVTIPPPGGGIVLIEMLNLFQELANGHVDPDSPETAVLFAYIIRKARKDRRKYNLGEFTRSGKKAPELTSTEYAKITAMKLRQQIEGSGETSHFNVIDKFGNIVAVTQSIERSFGAKV